VLPTADSCHKAIPIRMPGKGGRRFVFYAVVNKIVFHRGPGIGDGWTCPLPNRYAIEMTLTSPIPRPSSCRAPARRDVSFNQ